MSHFKKLQCKQKGSALVWILLLFLILSIPGYFISQNYNILTPKTPGLSLIKTEEKILIEPIPGSKYHSPDGTWWGYNQSKIARFQDLVFSYYIDNTDDSNQTISNLVVLKKEGTSAWEEGVRFPTSRPGNILVDSQGVLHVFVFEPANAQINDSKGKLLHYFFPDSAQGDIKNFSQELVVDGDGSNETVNIRVGSAIGKDDTMVISFGLTKFNPAYNEQSEHIYFKKPNEEKWNHTFIDGLPHDFYYPYTLVTENGFSLLPIQDDFNDDGNSKTYDNIYQKIPLFSYLNNKWGMEMLVDLSTHPLAKSKPRLLEQEDLMEDKDGNIHIIYKEFLDPDNLFASSGHRHLIGKPGNFKTKKIELGKAGANWVRLVEVDSDLYYLISRFDSLYTSPVDDIKLNEISIPDDAKGFYPYVATQKSGQVSSEYIDVLLLASDQKLYQEGLQTNYYIRIPKSDFKK
ncbi:MAG: hypothetical protein Q7S88_01290 [Candidatus Daviesbacteria bacterium]|nr:hypothetical protein [Candidatus Daviesbacteria bacterium]